ncbi:MAG: hypothetical protein IH934_04980 [Nanoarchaeota archaeon]|nr:hypothetical protein [Nanoarchaeota archaeon]
MVFIIEKQTPNRCDLILIPNKQLKGFLFKHVKRKNLDPNNLNTCLVNEHDNWTGEPSFKDAIKLLKETLYSQRIIKGENRYPIPHHLFFNKIKCKSFDGKNNPVTKEYDGDFFIDFYKIKKGGGAKLAKKEFSVYEAIGPFSNMKIKRILKKFDTSCKISFIFITHHFYVVRRR